MKGFHLVSQLGLWDQCLPDELPTVNCKTTSLLQAKIEYMLDLLYSVYNRQSVYNSFSHSPILFLLLTVHKMVLSGQLWSLQALPTTSWPQEDYPGGVGGCRALLGAEEAVHCRRKREGRRKAVKKEEKPFFADPITLGWEVCNGLVSVECLSNDTIAGEECLRVAVVEGKSSNHVLLHAPCLLCQSWSHLLTFGRVEHKMVHICVCV